jgi:hypothetical protein
MADGGNKFSDLLGNSPSQPAPSSSSSSGDNKFADLLSGGGSSASKVAKKGGGGGLFGSLGHFAGGALHLTTELPVSLAKGLYHAGGEVAQSAGIAPQQILTQFKNLSPTYKMSQAETHSSPLANALTGDASGDKGMHVLRQQAPVLYGQGTSLARTVREVPDTAAAVRIPGLHPNAAGFGQSLLGKEIKQEGYAGAALAKGADVLTLASMGAGALGAAGFGGAADALKASKLATKILDKAGVEGVTTAAEARAAATAAEHAGHA